MLYPVRDRTKEGTMRIERAEAKKGSRSFLVAVLMDLGLIVAAILSMGSTPSGHATPSVEAASGEAATSASTARNSVWPREAIADRDRLDLQLD
ncbi:MAG: hypothetical protein ACXVID_08955 [Thermoanaerobaculia bacterium]